MITTEEFPPRVTERQIEESSLRAWPALSETDFDGWRLRFSNGYTRRANSITPLDESRLDLHDKVATCERLYLERGLPPIFRLTPFAPNGLDTLLEQRGYRLGDRVDVLARSLDAPVLRWRPAVKARVQTHSPNAWLKIFDSLSGIHSDEIRANHRQILEKVSGVRRLVALSPQTKPSACGMSVLDGDQLGLFDLITAAAERDKGHASELLFRTLAWGRRNGARLAYLQVLDRNVAAQRIYDRAQFRLVYRYHYREKS